MALLSRVPTSRGFPDRRAPAGLNLDPDDTQAIADAILSLRTDRPLRGHLVGRRRSRASHLRWNSSMALTARKSDAVGRDRAVLREDPGHHGR